MDATQFLDRLIAPGNWYVVAYKKSPAEPFFSHKHFRTAKEAADHVVWRSSQGMDTWHACSSYMNEVDKPTKAGGTYKAVPRKQENVAKIKAFWVDLDIARPGDGKDPTKVYADGPAAVAWINQFTSTTGMPNPNLLVQSGYGMHLYWTLEDPVDPATWQPYAEALKALLVSTGSLADIMVTADSARILRTPGTQNYKVPASPAPVRLLRDKPDYPNAMIYAALQAHVSATTTVVNGLGPTPAHVQSSTLNTAAQANTTIAKTMQFANIAKNCKQVAHSLNTHGASDNRPIWYLGNLSLAWHTVDGASYVHEVSNGHPAYTAADTDAMVALIDSEKNGKNSGPPSCKFYNANRPGICQTCPFFGKVTSPWNTGAKDGDFPEGYRRHNQKIQKSKAVKDIIVWDNVVDGDVYAPVLSVTNNVYNLSFTYEMAGRSSPVSFSALDYGADIGPILRHFNSQRMTLDANNARLFGDFAMSFQNMLRLQRAEREDAVLPYGWVIKENTDPPEVLGMAIAGNYYKADGTHEAVPGAEPHQAEAYKPRGMLTTWKKAADFIARGRPDAQLMLAASMAAPLMHFSGQPALVMNFYSSASGIGKSSACKVAQNVWATSGTMASMSDTENSVRGKIAEARFMPLIWDELRVDDQNARAKTEFFFTMAQGKDKTRMRADASIREGKEWQTLMMCTSNQPLLSYISGLDAGSDAGGMRLMDFEIDVQPLPHDPNTAIMIANAGTASGQAGKVLAEHYAQNATRIAAAIVATSTELTKIMDAKTDERFYIAGTACCIVAAKEAVKLGLVNFDVKQMIRYIIDNWRKIRGEKGSDMTKAGKIDLPEMFGRFYSDYSARLVITNYFKNRGRMKIGPDAFTTVAAPNLVSQPVVMHGAQREKLLRVDLFTFKTWLIKKNLSPANVLAAMKDAWGITFDQKLILGAGSPYAGGQKATLEIGLGHPDLTDYEALIGDDPNDPANGTVAKAKKATAQALAGNQAAVV